MNKGYQNPLGNTTLRVNVVFFIFLQGSSSGVEYPLGEMRFPGLQSALPIPRYDVVSLMLSLKTKGRGKKKKKNLI